MIRRPGVASNSRGSSIFQPSVTMEVLRKFKKRPTQLLRGYTALAGRNLPFTAMQFPMFEHLRSTIVEYRKQRGKHNGSLLETGLITGLSAGSAGSLAAVITTPVDVIKTRIMLSAAGEKIEPSPLRVLLDNQMRHAVEQKSKPSVRKSSITVAQEVVTEAGIKGLFRGGILRAVWTALGSGLYLGVYESGKSWLGEGREQATSDL